MTAFKTPFRERYESSRRLDLQAQIEECVDYLENPEVLITEFLEACYQVERELDPEREDEQLEESRREVVLEPFAQDMELRIRGPRGRVEVVRCVSGAVDPLPEAIHPALDRQALDYIGIREGTDRLVLGVTETFEKQSVYQLLLRGLNCIAELTPPFQLARLARHVLQGCGQADVPFDLQLGLARRERSALETSLEVLSRDLVELLKTRLAQHEPLSESVGRVECLQFEAEASQAGAALVARWRA